MKILVTGGFGYLGSHVVDELNKSHEVTIVDSGIYKGNKDETSLDIQNGNVLDLIKNSDAVIHLAAIVGDKACNINPEATKKINFEATKNIAKACAENDVRFVFASTCSIYGESKKELKVKENETDARPVSLYGWTKLESEKYITSLDNLNYSILRLGTLFGWSKRMRFDLAINLFIAQALNGENLTVFGGNQWRPFLHVKDAAKSFVNMAKTDTNGIYNLAWKNMKIIDAAKIISEKLEVEYKINKDIADIRNYKVNTEKINLVGTQPKIGIIEAIEEIKKENKTWENYKENIYSNYKSLVKIPERLRYGN